MGRSARLERENVIRDLGRARGALSAELEALDSKAGDWTNWDDAYTFVHGDNPEFVAKNIAPESFVQLKVNLIAFVDTSNRVVVEQAVEGILLVDVDTQRVLETNRSLQTLLGYSATELQGFALHDFALRDAATTEECSLECVMEKLSATPISGERQARRKRGSWVSVEVNANLVSSDSSRILCVVFHDISQRRKAEEELLLRDRATRPSDRASSFPTPTSPIIPSFT